MNDGMFPVGLNNMAAFRLISNRPGGIAGNTSMFLEWRTMALPGRN